MNLPMELIAQLAAMGLTDETTPEAVAALQRPLRATYQELQAQKNQVNFLDCTDEAQFQDYEREWVRLHEAQFHQAVEQLQLIDFHLQQRGGPYLTLRGGFEERSEVARYGVHGQLVCSLAEEIADWAAVAGHSHEIIKDSLLTRDENHQWNQWIDMVVGHRKFMVVLWGDQLNVAELRSSKAARRRLAAEAEAKGEYPLVLDLIREANVQVGCTQSIYNLDVEPVLQYIQVKLAEPVPDDDDELD